MLAARRVDQLQRLVECIRAAVAQAIAVETDVAKRDDMERLGPIERSNSDSMEPHLAVARKGGLPLNLFTLLPCGTQLWALATSRYQPSIHPVTWSVALAMCFSTVLMLKLLRWAICR